ncbi:N-acetylmuramoyl-L-alanine amidase [Croceitalea sp. MTPC5]|uniref:N-acetylmuramoyl-L-alanine amidase family protein n=1 Tax=Croceitalea sp. MTPC5 TaxID=3056565 RepID=UPI002B3D7E78|nr:N-acetylmuramoyl-L-alanine amidase [Croceitalea sp. MTPC5]
MKFSKTLLLLCFFTVIQTGISQEKKVIIIDAGHGGKDYGAIGINSSKEKDINFSIAKTMLLYNRTILDNKYEIYLSRYKDTLISLSHRTRLVKALQPDLFISIHCNHAPNKNATGIEMFLHNGTSLKHDHQIHAKGIAKEMITALTEQLGYRSRGIKTANFQVLRQSIATCPAILVELGFLSNIDEATYLESKEHMNALALVLLMSIKI